MPNPESRRRSSASLNDGSPECSDNPNMTDEAPDWHLREWLLHLGKRQASLVNELGWDKSRANFLWHSKQPYRRDDVNAVAKWLNIAPHELLMRPAEALALRRLRETAAEIVGATEAEQ